jgi:hypothetical protein
MQVARQCRGKTRRFLVVLPAACLPCTRSVVTAKIAIIAALLFFNSFWPRDGSFTIHLYKPRFALSEAIHSWKRIALGERALVAS